MNYSLNAGEWNSVFAVPSSVVDKYIKIAGGNSLKLLLFLLRHGGESFSEKELKEALGFRLEGELEDAAQFWAQRGIVRFEGAPDTALSPAAPAEEAVSEPAEQLTLSEVRPDKAPLPARRVGEGSLFYTSGDINRIINRDSNTKAFFKNAEGIYGRAMTQKELQSTASLIDYYGLPIPVALTLLDHCFRIKKTSIAYIQKCAESWSEDGINTLDLAEERIRLVTRRGSVEDGLKAAMEMKSAFAPKQKEFIRTWSEEWGFGEDMIMLAYDITLNSTGKLSFPYMNKILESWRAEGITTAEGARRKQEEYKTKNTQKNGFASRPAAKPSGRSAQSSFDVNEIMAQIHNRSDGANAPRGSSVNTGELIAQIRAGKI